MKLTDLCEKRREVFALYEKKERDIEEDIRILREWMLKVTHLPSDLIEDQFLESCLLNNKFSIEKCKQKIEMYCTVKGDPKYQYLYNRIGVPSKEAAFRTPLPQLTEDYKRLFVSVFHEDRYDISEDVNSVVVLREFLLRFDYNDGEIYIFDMRKCSINFISKVRLNIMADGFYIIMNACSARISAVHIISNIDKTLFSIVIMALPKKLQSKLYFHDNEESLKKIIPSKYLPKDFGGDLQTLENIKAAWDEIYQENQSYLRKLINIKSREEHRLPGSSKNEELQGTFKKLSID